MTDRYAVIGNPIAHSKSPALHAAFARQCSQDIRYEAILGPLDGFRAAVEAFRQAGGRGMNVTVPFKVEALALADTLTERARLAQAVNTLRFEADGIFGDNTDGIGLVNDIQQRLGFAIGGKRVLILGAGGAARGSVLPLAEAGPARLVIVNRTQAKAEALREQFAGVAALDVEPCDGLAGQSFDLVINATSAGLHGESLPLPAGIFAPGALAYDMVYGNTGTPFMAAARALGASRVSDGLGMLVGQAAESFFLWRGVRPDTAPVLQMLRGG
ncbi:MAG: shikimate dehydrogenase [Zoogloea sp.]|uniref:shikimate dehydrogenase n=1 Tax=Zoogloea sp. TaxID=49181 RepID=UPI0026291AFC|nr:shikimate dehydrogenase [Zoogloea sp.]MDD3326107.1 shikimate dehydrogenase [Zoogloea sp.]